MHQKFLMAKILSPKTETETKEWGGGGLIRAILCPVAPALPHAKIDLSLEKKGKIIEGIFLTV